jgi:magnesium chelatase subunit D
LFFSMKYPFAALVGQDKLKRALILCAINPSIGGLLIRGEKGTAKSTAARGLAAIMPLISRSETGMINVPEHDSLTEQIPVPFVNLPLGATEDRVLGSLDLEGILSEKKKRLQPGLLAAAHRGILYIDEVNLLADHLVDVLLDVAAMGVNTIQRDGLSESHPAKFTLIGTMNPEEGNLRPQFLDRFGLMVEVEAPRDVSIAMG